MRQMRRYAGIEDETQLQRVLDEAAVLARQDGISNELKATLEGIGVLLERISLTYETMEGQGKTTPHTDTHHGRFVALVPDREVVEVVEFESDDVSMRGQMTISISLADGAHGGTDVAAIHAGLPGGVSPADNETGWRMALAKLADLVEAGA